jgi:hypothetical protein
MLNWPLQLYVSFPVNGRMSETPISSSFFLILSVCGKAYMETAIYYFANTEVDIAASDVFASQRFNKTMISSSFPFGLKREGNTYGSN